MPTRDPDKLAAKHARYDAKRRAAPGGNDRHATRRRAVDAPFVGVDGEGAGPEGKHEYLMLRAGDRLLTTGKPLTAQESLTFLADLPGRKTYVAFAFDYDVAMMLRALPFPKLRALCQREARRYLQLRPDGSHRYSYHPVTWGGFELDYLPRREFRVRHRTPRGVKTPPWTVVSDVFGLFQCSFVKSLEAWGAGTPEQRQLVAEGKARRGGVTLSPEDEAYNRVECELLAEMMEDVRAACKAAGIVPAKWQGAGRLAGAMLKARAAPLSVHVRAKTPRSTWDAARKAYYGGRFEVARFGHSTETVHEYDLASAYPAAMVNLPCLLHGTWRRLRKEPPPGSLYLARITWWPDDNAVADRMATGMNLARATPNLGPFPIRAKTGTITFPLSGTGWYWSVEIDAARTMGFDVTVSTAHAFTPDCDHRPYEWIPDVYAERVRLGKSGKGKVLKLALNSLYGKTAQARPELGAYANWLYAGMITAATRAAVNTLCTEHNGHCVAMIATDGVYLDHEVPELDLTPRLGAWEHEAIPSMFTIMPGMYRKGADELKTRGIPQASVRSALDTLIARFDQGATPTVTIHRNTFHALRIGVHRNRPDIIGQWIDAGKELRIRTAPKREAPRRVGGAIVTEPPEGHHELESVEHTGMLAVDKAVRSNSMVDDGEPGGYDRDDFLDLPGDE